MPDDTQVLTKVLNEQLQFSFKDAGFSYNEDYHLNMTANGASGPHHIIEQGNFTDTFGSDYSVTGKFNYVQNANHITNIADYKYSYGGNTYEYKSNYTSNGNGYNIVEQHYVNGDPTGVFHYNG